MLALLLDSSRDAVVPEWTMNMVMGAGGAVLGFVVSYVKLKALVDSLARQVDRLVERVDELEGITNKLDKDVLVIQKIDEARERSTPVVGVPYKP